MRQADENGTHANDCRGKPDTAEWLAESTRAQSVRVDTVYQPLRSGRI